MPAIRRPSQGPSPLGPDFRFNPVPRSTESPAGGTGNWFVRSGAKGTATGLNWLNAFLTLTAAFTSAVAGDTIWVSDDHAETQASAMALTSVGTSASPCKVYCVNRSGSIPPVSADLRTTATITTTGASSISFDGFAHFYGIIFTAGNTSGSASVTLASASDIGFVFDSCSLRLGGTSTLSRVVLGSGGTTISSYVKLRNTTVSFAAVGQGITCRESFLIWENTPSAILGSVPTTLFLTAFVPASVLLHGVDFSALGAGNTLVGSLASPGTFMFKDCKFGASVVVAVTPASHGASETLVIRGDSSGTNYRHEKYRYEGTQTVETTIVRTGGASDGTTPLSWKIVTTANSKWFLPFEALPIAIWNDTTGSPVTVTIEGIWGSAWVPNTDDIWIDIEYLGASANPQGSFATGSKADNLAAGTNWATSSQVWGGSTTAFKMAVTITSPQQKGYIYIYVKAAKASATFYIDPKATLS